MLRLIDQQRKDSMTVASQPVESGFPRSFYWPCRQQTRRALTITTTTTTTRISTATTILKSIGVHSFQRITWFFLVINRFNQSIGSCDGFRVSEELAIQVYQSIGFSSQSILGTTQHFIVGQEEEMSLPNSSWIRNNCCLSCDLSSRREEEILRP